MTTGNSSAMFGSPIGQTPAAIVNLFSTNGYTSHLIDSNVVEAAVALSLSGVLSAGVLKTALNVTGAGVIHFMGASATDTTSRTLRMKLTLDGVVVFDSTSAAFAVARYGGWVVGNVNSIFANVYPEAIPFSTSCLFEIASSLTETDKLNILLKYRTN